MSKLNVFTIFGIMFLSSVLLGSGTFLSNNTSILAQENEAEVEVDIEQENKCKQDTECKNENEINNSLTITTITKAQEEQPETPTCETCFTDNLSQEQLNAYVNAFANFVQREILTVQQLCDYIDQEQGVLQLDIALSAAAAISNLSIEQYETLIQCLQDAGFDVEIPPI